MIGRSNAKTRERGQSLMMLCIMMPMLMPLLGISYDMLVAYTVQTRLSAAVDGASLAAGRLLGTSVGNSGTSVQQIAGEFLAANFQGFPYPAPTSMTSAAPGFWGTNAYTATITYTPPSAANPVRTISITARVDVPVTFMRIYGYTTSPAGTGAVATRGQVRVMLVIDRSGSMTDVLDSVMAQAIKFTESYVPQGNGGQVIDEMGLVVFGASGIVAYPNYVQGTANSTNVYLQPASSVAAGAASYPTTCASGCYYPTTSANPVVKVSYPAGATNTTLWGPDGNFYNPNTIASAPGGSPYDMVYMENAVVANGNTGMAEAISLAYAELQRAHNADWVRNGGYDPMFNYIVLFTDGVPNEISVNLNNARANGATPSSNALASPTATSTSTPLPSSAAYVTTSCKWNPSLGGAYAMSIYGTAAEQMVGNIGDIGGSSGIFQLASLSTAENTLWFVKNPGSNINTPANSDLSAISNAGTAFTGCGTIRISGTTQTELTTNGTQNNDYDLSALKQLPPYDIYGNLTSGTAYTNSTGTSDANNAIKSIAYAPTTNTSVNSGDQWQVAAWNAVYNAANTIRSSAAAGNPITIYTIGYTGDGGTDAGLLTAVANDVSGGTYNSAQPQGHYYEASTIAAISAALQNIQGQTLRLSQ